MNEPIQKVPLCEKELLTLHEAAALFGVGINRIRDMTNAEHCSFVLFVGGKRLIKRRLFLEYLEQAYSI